MIQDKVKNSERIRQLQVLAIVAAVAVIAIVAIILFQSSAGSSSTIDYTNIPQSRTEDGGFVLGNPEATVTIVLFEDFLCPHCQAYQPEVKSFIRDYVATGEAQLEFRMVTAVDPVYSALAFELAQCSDQLKPGSFWAAHDALFDLASTRRFSDQSARTFAEQMGLAYTEVLTCTQSALQWQTDAVLAQQSGVQGTPTVGWRLNGGEIQFAPLSSRPTAAELGALVTGINAQ